MFFSFFPHFTLSFCIWYASDSRHHLYGMLPFFCLFLPRLTATFLILFMAVEVSQLSAWQGHCSCDTHCSRCSPPDNFKKLITSASCFATLIFVHFIWEISACVLNRRTLPLQTIEGCIYLIFAQHFTYCIFVDRDVNNNT